MQSCSSSTSSLFWLNSVKLSGEKFNEEDDIRDLIKSTPAIVIFGKSQTAKGRLLNKIFGEEIYPEIDESDQSAWRTVRSGFYTFMSHMSFVIKYYSV